MENGVAFRRKTFLQRLKKDIIENRYVYLLAIPVVLYFFVFKYIPMYGAIIAFKNFSPGKGILNSPWVGLQNFRDFFQGIYFVRVLRNTLLMNFYNLIFGFPAPIILALLINEIRSHRFKKAVQTITYMPYFISLVVIAGMVLDFTSLNGFISKIVNSFSSERILIMSESRFFRPVYVITDIWQNVGFGSIIFLAAITGIDQQLYEAAKIDGAGRFKQAMHVTIPGILPTIVVMLILRFGSMMSLGYEKIILLYNPSTYETADVISSYVYRKGLQDFSYSFSAAVGIFNSVVNFMMLIIANTVSKKVQETSLW